MKLKSIVLTIVAAALFLFSGNTSRAQGMFKNKESYAQNQTQQDDGAKTTDSTGGMFKAGGDGGGEGGGAAPGDNSDPNPIGGGILVLSLLSGGYALIKRNGRRKYED